MTAMIADFLDTYNRVFTENADARVYSWPLMSGPLTVLTITLTYIYFVTSLGPNIMKNRKPYKLKNILIVYNVSQIVLCIYLFHRVLTSGWTTKYTLRCEPVDYSNDPLALRMAGAIWLGSMVRLVEFIETVFFVLRKKQNQITFLHVYHHVSTVWFTWIGTKFVPGGMASFSLMVNSFVHIIMYTYYLLALIGSPRVIKLISKWKKYLTIFQMVQLVIIIVHAVQMLHPKCNMPKSLACVFLPYMFLMFYLFYDFFQNMYKPKVG